MSVSHKTIYRDDRLGNGGGVTLSFKTSTGNPTRTAPHTRNRAFGSLGGVVEFHELGGGSIGLDGPRQTLPLDALELDEGAVADLMALLAALTDAG